MHFGSIYVASHQGLVGSAVLRNLKKNSYQNLLVRTRQQLDLRSGEKVEKFLFEARPTAVVVAAAKVGGHQGELRLIRQSFCWRIFKFKTI
jgi:GDP-L-fucose synthase